MRADRHGEIESIVARAQAGDIRAFDELVERTNRTAYQLALRMLGNEADAADVVQEAYIGVWQSLHTLREPGAALGWICRIVRNLAVARIRQSERRRADSLDQPPARGLGALIDYIAADDPGPEQALASAEAREAMWAVVDQLKEKHSLVLLLREVDGMSYTELAAALDCPVGTVESRLYRARKELASKLKRLLRKQAEEAA